MTAGNALPAPAPPVNPETRPFWTATTQGELLLKRCDDCAAVVWYPRAICPECTGTTSWFPASGRGTVYSFTVIRRGGAYPGPGAYVLAYVELDEGPRILTNIVDSDPDDPDDLAVGDPVTVVFHPAGPDAALPRFAVTGGAA